MRYERQIELPPLNPEKVSDEACRALACAIVKQALKDYRSSFYKLKKLRYKHHQERARKKAQELMDECEDFLMHTESIGFDEKTAGRIAASFKKYKASLMQSGTHITQ